MWVILGVLNSIIIRQLILKVEIIYSLPSPITLDILIPILLKLI